MVKKKIPMLSWGILISFFVLWVVPQGILAQDEETRERYRGLRLSFHVGATYPLRFGSVPDEYHDLIPDNYLDGLADSNVHFRFNLDYVLSDKLELVAFMGFSQFTDDYAVSVHYYTFNFSANLKWFFPSPSGLKWYWQGGPGLYIPKPNLPLPYPTTSTMGFNVGFGARIPLSGPFDIEWGIDMHNINFSKSEEPKFWFLTLQLGVLFK
jgi:hypothetical protein